MLRNAPRRAKVQARHLVLFRLGRRLERQRRTRWLLLLLLRRRRQRRHPPLLVQERRVKLVGRRVAAQRGLREPLVGLGEGIVVARDEQRRLRQPLPLPDGTRAQERVKLGQATGARRHLGRVGVAVAEFLLRALFPVLGQQAREGEARAAAVAAAAV